MLVLLLLGGVVAAAALPTPSLLVSSSSSSWICNLEQSSHRPPPHPMDDDAAESSPLAVVVESTTVDGVIVVWNYGRHGNGGWSMPGCDAAAIRFGTNKTRLLSFLESQPSSTQIAWRKAQDVYFLEQVYDVAEERMREALQLMNRARRIVRELQQDLAAAHLVAPIQAEAIAEELQRRAEMMTVV